MPAPGCAWREGDAAAALADLVEVGRRQEAMREPNPAGADWRSQAAQAHAALGRVNDARALAREEVALARRFGAPRALGIALRALGAVNGELGHARGGGRRARRRRRPGSSTPARWPTWASRSGTAAASCNAREPLRRALDLAIRCEAAPLAERARAELLIAGARPRRWNATA